MSKIPMGPWKGMDNVSPEGSRPHDIVEDAVNVEFDRDGGAEVRRGIEKVDGGDWSSLWSSRTRRVFGVVGGNLCTVSIAANTISYTSIYALGSNNRASFAEIDGDIICTNRIEILRILHDDTVVPLGMRRPDSFSVSASAAGGLYEGRYHVAIAPMRYEEEGPLSFAVPVDVVANGGVSVTVPTDAAGFSVYRSQANGETLFHAGYVAAGGSLLLGATSVGRVADNMYLDRLPPGDIVRYWRGLALVARGRILYWSEPMRYGLYSPRHNFVEMTDEIVLLEPVDGGVYIGDKHGVRFMVGPSPKEWTVRNKSGVRPIAYSGTRAQESLFGEGDQEVAVWLSQNGFSIGKPDGSILETQSKNIRLTDAQSGGKGSTVLYDRRVITSIQ